MALLAGVLVLIVASVGRSASPVAGLCAAAWTGDPTAPRMAVVSAFPAELAPLVAVADVEATVVAGGRSYHLGQLAGVRVVLGLTGIGLVNAEYATQALLTHFDVAGIVMSGVAGSHHRIGDVVLARRFREDGHGRRWRMNRALLALAWRAVDALPAPFERCTPVPPTDPDAPVVCLPHAPAVVSARLGLSGDPFGGAAAPCVPDGGEILGCELPPAVSAPMRAQTADVEDMETAAVARVAAERHVPFLALRAVSDGAGDPLGDRGFPAQFFDYYRLAARNAAIVTRGTLAELGRIAGDESGGRTCRLLARARWRRGARRIRASADAAPGPGLP